MYFDIDVPVLSVGVSLHSMLLYPYIYYYIHSGYSVTIGMANPKSGIGRQINYPVVLSCTGNEKDLETKRLRDSHACIFSVHLVIRV